MSIASIHNALAGMIANQDRMIRVADRVSRWRDGATASGPAPVDLVREVVEVKKALGGFEANAAVMRTADRMTGLILDDYA